LTDLRYPRARSHAADLQAGARARGGDGLSGCCNNSSSVADTKPVSRHQTAILEAKDAELSALQKQFEAAKTYTLIQQR